MKTRAYCKTCKKDVRPVSTIINTPPYIISYKCETCASNINPADINVESLSFEECMEVAKCLEDGYPHPDYPDILNKVGTIHYCKKCKAVFGIKNYCNVDFMASQMACSECPSYYKKEEGGKIKGFCSEIEKKLGVVDLATLRAQKIMEIINNIFEKTPPQSDSIFEFDRILWFITEIELPRDDMIDELFLADDEYRMIMDVFMLKCTEIGVARLRN